MLRAFLEHSQGTLAVLLRNLRNQEQGGKIPNCHQFLLIKISITRESLSPFHPSRGKDDLVEIFHNSKQIFEHEQFIMNYENESSCMQLLYMVFFIGRFRILKPTKKTKKYRVRLNPRGRAIFFYFADFYLVINNRPGGRAPDTAEPEIWHNVRLKNARFQTADCTNTGARKECGKSRTHFYFNVFAGRRESIAGVPAKI